MRSLSVGAFAVAALLCVMPFSVRWSQGNGTSLTVASDSARAADLSIPARHHRHYAYRYSRLYNPWCNGPYTGGGIGDINGSTYYGGPFIDLRCYGGVY
jgi:hypothetical protein